MNGTPIAKPPPWRVWVSAARPRTLPAAIAPVLVGSALAARAHHFAGGAAALCLAFALLVQVGTNFANDYYDFLKGADTAGRVGPRRAVAAGWVAPRAMRDAMAATFAVAFVLGLFLIAWGGIWLLVIGCASIACGIAYTAGPCPLAYLGLGDVFVFLFFGPVAVMATCYVQAGSAGRAAFLAAIPIGLLTANILLVNNYRDFETDIAAGKKTLVVRFGRRFARAQHAVSFTVSLLIPVILLIRGDRPWILLPELVIPIGWSHIRRLRRARDPAALIGLLSDTGRLLALYAAFFAVGILAG
ncbi:MAG: 1,4-dihydroxy-2-naphthoate polyprenyltransferase [Opitutaceae bacterium]